MGANDPGAGPGPDRAIPPATVLVAAWRRADHLARVLAGLERQSQAGFETVVCEDGTSTAIERVVARYRERLAGGLLHVRQEDRGFRKCRILNEGVRRTRGEYLIFLDGDCVPHRDFVAAHLRYRRHGCFLVGRRVLLGAELTARLTEEDVRRGRLDRPWFAWVAWMRGQARHPEAALRLPPPLAARFGPVRMKGCNFSCWREDLVAINGFDERFERPGIGEDSDVRRRLELLGRKAVPVKHAAVCFHLDHPRGLRRREPAPQWYREEVARRSPWCPAGLQRCAA